MKMIEKTIEFIKSFSGFVFMLLVMFYLHYYEFNPIYKPVYN